MDIGGDILKHDSHASDCWHFVCPCNTCGSPCSDFELRPKLYPQAREALSVAISSLASISIVSSSR